MRIALDAMGGDAAPETTVAGALRAAREFPIDLILVGQQDAIERSLSRYPSQRPSNLSILHAPEVIGMDESPVASRSEEHTSELQSQFHLVCRLLLVKT